MYKFVKLLNLPMDDLYTQEYFIISSCFSLARNLIQLRWDSTNANRNLLVMGMRARETEWERGTGSGEIVRRELALKAAAGRRHLRLYASWDPAARTWSSPAPQSSRSRLSNLSDNLFSIFTAFLSSSLFVNSPVIVRSLFLNKWWRYISQSGT